LNRLLEEKHINKSQLQLKFDYYDWNWQLCISTAFVSCLSIIPYIRLIMEESPGFGSGLPFCKPKPDETGPKQWLPGQAKPGKY
jgi:hypothetical protein